MKNKKGFTLIELLAVITILGVLLTFSVVAVNKIRNEQEVKNRLNVISGIMTGAREYISDHPKVLNDLYNYDPKIAIVQISVVDLIDGNYISVDENKYPEYIYRTWNNSNESRNFSVYKCNNDSVKYSIQFHDKINGYTIRYSDCGCETQNSLNKSKILCSAQKQTNNDCKDGICAGWDQNGNYFDNENNKASYSAVILDDEGNEIGYSEPAENIFELYNLIKSNSRISDEN